MCVNLTTAATRLGSGCSATASCGRVDPWLAAMGLVAPLALPFVLPIVPDPVTIGLFLYIGESQLQAVIAYGGCDIAGVPSLLLRRRYTIYCSLKHSVDPVERWFQSRVGPPRYRVQVGHRAISSGEDCSVDMFLLTLATGLPVHAEATCPATGAPVTVDLFPDQVESVDPPGAVVAVVDPGVIRITGRAPGDALICSQQPFFASAEAASAWLAEHRGGRIFGVREYLEHARQNVRRLQNRPPTPR